MRQAIVTKCLGATNFRGSRVKATASAGSVTLSWDHSLDSEGNHIRAAMAVAVKYGWRGDWSGGGTENGYVFAVQGTGPEFTS